jgi:ferric-dicitrate binding protein FerR (iron transport regulator)
MKAVRRDTVESQLENLARMARQWAAAAPSEPGAAPPRPARPWEHDQFPSQTFQSIDQQPPDGQARQWLALERSMQKRAQAVARRRFVGASAVALTAVAALMVVRGLGRSDRNLSFVASEGTASVGGTVHPEQIPVRLSFSDGSDVILHPGARGAVIGTTKRGARVRLEEGRARFTVAHRPKTEWSVEAGPFTVVVHGTVFDVGWSRETGALVVDLLIGSVTIRGPVSGRSGTVAGTVTGTVTMTAGQRLTALAATGLNRLSRIDRTDTPDGVAEPGANAPGPAAAPAGAVVAPTEGAAAPPAGAILEVAPAVASNAAPADVVPADAADRRSAVRRQHAAADPGALDLPRRFSRSMPAVAGIPADWSVRVASGAFQGVVDEADAIGVEQCLARAPAESLVALADAARYVRRTDLARQALLAERRRFARSVGAHDAAFLIGRLAEDTSGDLREALLWYDRYLEQSQGDSGHDGTYASEALGRKMLALDRLGEAADARVTAEHYLTAFPTGAFATRARRIHLKP